MILLIVTVVGLGLAADVVAAESFVTPVLVRRHMGASGDSRLGESVTAGDIDRDGVPDLVAGAPGAPAGGRVWAYSGSDGHLLFTLSPPGAGGAFGAEVDVIGDVTGDGIVDLVVADPAQKSAYLFSGADGSLLSHAALPYEFGVDAGHSVNGVGDVNGDGRADFVIARRGSSAGADVFSGASGEPLVSFVPAAFESVDGAAVSMGDLDGDGIAEVAIAFPFSTGVFSAATGQRLRGSCRRGRSIDGGGGEPQD